MISSSPISGSPISGTSDLSGGTRILTLIDKLKADNTIKRVYLLEATISSGDFIEDAGINDFGQSDLIQVSAEIKLSTTGYATDTEGFDDQIYDALIQQPFNFGSRLFQSNEMNGSSTPGTGDITLLNGDGSLDYSLEMDWDQGDIVIKVGMEDSPYTEFEPILKAVADGITWDLDTINIRLRDKRATLNKAIQQSFYGVGDCPNLVGKPKPLCVGQVRNITPACVNPVSQIYQVHDGEIKAIDAVYFNGLQATAGSDYTVDLLTGQFTLLVNPNGLVTVDVRGAIVDGIYITTCSDIVKYIASTYGGIESFDEVSFSQVNFINASVVGIYTGTEPKTVNAILDSLVESIGGWWRFTRLDQFQIGVFSTIGETALSITKENITRISRVASPVRPRLTNLQYKKNWTVITPDALAGAVIDENVTFYSNEFRNVVSGNENPDEVSQFSRERYVSTLLDSTIDAQTEVDRQQALFGDKQKSIYDITLDSLLFKDVIGKNIFITYNRFGLDDGRVFKIIGSKENGRFDEQTLTIWG